MLQSLPLPSFSNLLIGAFENLSRSLSAERRSLDNTATPGRSSVRTDTTRRHWRSKRPPLDELRRYVPGPIAEQITNGESLESRETDVTVMFIDLRGYTSFAERLSPQQVFAFLNQYTQAVSRIVRQHGGFVVEFNGDGMMVVFGAPIPVREKEKAALMAGSEIERAVAELDPQLPARSSSHRHRVGIGIATGPAFVGNIRAVDRYIWSAVGATTNRASRLEALTRELDVSIVVDRATCESAGAVPGFVEYGSVGISGLSAPVDLFVHPQMQAIH